MICPNCHSTNDDGATACLICGKALRGSATIRQGSVVAGRYEILETLGKGGMGMVYKALDRTLDEEVALKLLRADIAADPEMAVRFRREIKLARKVRHRNVCGIHEYGEDGPLRFIAMEFIAGVDMRQILKQRGAPPPDEAFEIVIQIGEGLQAIHDAGVIHRDLKTPNIMRDAKGVVRLMDFGIAKQVGAEATLGATAIGMIVGTPEYMSPEQARGEKVDFRSDIYALGIVAFEIFTGSVPFQGETPIATIFKHLQEPPPLEGLKAEGLPAGAVPVLRKALAKEAGDRFATASEMVEALKRARAEFLSRPTLAAAPATVGAVALGTQPQPAPTQGMPTPVPTNVPTAVRTAVTAAAAQVSEVRSKAAIERERTERERVRALKTACDGMDAALRRGAPEEAASVLAQAQADLGDTDPLPAYAARIEAASRQAAVQQLLAQAAAQLRIQSFDQAQRLAEQAQTQDPSNAKARSLLDQIGTSRKRQAEEAQQAAEAERRQAAEAERREEAARRIQEQERKRAEEEKQRIEEERRRVQEERRRAEEARQREEAARRVQEQERKRAEEEKQRAEEARRRAEAERRQAEEAQRKAAAIAAAIAGVEAQIARGDFDGASRAATTAQRDHGRVDSLQQLPARIEAARREAQEAATRQILDRAETLAASQRFEEGIQALREALRREPGHVQARNRLAALEELHRGQELAKAVAALDLLLSRGYLEQARSELQAAEKTYGKNEALKRLRKSLQDLEKKQALAAAAAQAESAELKTRTSTAPVRSAEPTRPAVEALRPAAQLARPPAESPRPAAKPAASGRSAGLYLALGVAVMALTGGSLGWWLAHRGDTAPTTEPSVAPDSIPSADIAGTPSTQPAPSPIPAADLVPASGSGLLILDALPWGEVIEVLDSKGKRQALGDSPFTPLVLSLPPGDYKISIKNSGTPQPITLTATIKNAAVEKKTAEFKRIDADEYLKRAGF